MDNHCYILSTAQVSCQQPLCEDWLNDPIRYDQNYVRAIEPNTRDFIVPAEARRMSKILKRTICTAITALNTSGIKQPDAIITGTGMGCMENSEKFLIDLSNFGESCLKPTLFMQSTHNTISSLIAIVLKCHGYNNTYSHKGISSESALLDAWLQIKAGNIQTALVGSHDEVTPFMALVMERTHPMFGFISEASVSTMLSSSRDVCPPMCEIASVDLLYKPELPDIIKSAALSEESVLMLGLNGNSENDDPYLQILDSVPASVTALKYKHLFGDSHSSSAIAMHVCANILSKQSVPTHLVHSCPGASLKEVNEIVIINHSDKTAWSVVKLCKV